VPKIEVLCVKGEQRLVGQGLHRCVLQVREMAVKVHFSPEKDVKGLLKKAKEVDSKNRGLREKVDFLPRYYGVAITGITRGKHVEPAVVTFHEYIQPIHLYSVNIIKKIFELITKAGNMGYVLDMKPSNFGMKDKRVLYLDEYGVGKGPIPPDVLEDLAWMVGEFLRKIRWKRV